MENKTGRIDGRHEDEERQIEILHKDNSFLIRKYYVINEKKVYSSSIVLYYNVEIKRQKADYSKNGYFSIFCSSKHLQMELEKLFKESEAVSLGSLSIIPRKAAWSIRVDIFVINDQGGLLEACVVGVERALANILFPEQRLCFTDRSYFTTRKVAFSPRYSLLPVTAVIANNALLLDALPSEAEKAEGALLLVLNTQNEIVHSVFSGAVDKSVYLEQMEKIISYAQSKE